MGETYKNKKGVHCEGHTDKKGKIHVNFYDKDPKGPHEESIHINIDSKTGTGTIVEKSNGKKTTTNVGCYLTTACMKHYLKNFDDNCYELTVLRWFRDNFVSSEDIKHYYMVAQSIVEGINAEKNVDIIYDYIYDNIVDACVKAIENGNYIFAYNRYKESILSLEETFARQNLGKRLIKVLQVI